MVEITGVELEVALAATMSLIVVASGGMVVVLSATVMEGPVVVSSDGVLGDSVVVVALPGIAASMVETTGVDLEVALAVMVSFAVTVDGVPVVVASSATVVEGSTVTGSGGASGASVAVVTLIGAAVVWFAGPCSSGGTNVVALLPPAGGGVPSVVFDPLLAPVLPGVGLVNTVFQWLFCCLRRQVVNSFSTLLSSLVSFCVLASHWTSCALLLKRLFGVLPRRLPGGGG